MHSLSQFSANQILMHQQFLRHYRLPPSYSRPRLRWTAELHERFIEAISELGGIDRAKPRMILERMNVTGMTTFHIKSHLQKYRRDVKSGNELPPPEYDGLLAFSNGSRVRCNIDVASLQHEFLDLNRPIEDEAVAASMLFEAGQGMMNPQNQYGAQTDQCIMNFEDTYGAHLVPVGAQFMDFNQGPFLARIFPEQRMDFQYQHQNNTSQMYLYLNVQQHYSNAMLEQAGMMPPSNGRFA